MIAYPPYCEPTPCVDTTTTTQPPPPFPPRRIADGGVDIADSAIIGAVFLAAGIAVAWAGRRRNPKGTP